MRLRQFQRCYVAQVVIPAKSGNPAMARAAAVALGSAETLWHVRNNEHGPGSQRATCGTSAPLNFIASSRLSGSSYAASQAVTTYTAIPMSRDRRACDPAGGSKPCQIPQFLEMVEEHCLKMERRR
jgi:hypothetical protein